METTEQLKEQIAALQQQIKEQEKLASLGLLTAGIVHEIRNPLNFVINFSKLSDTLIKDLADDIDDNADKISSDDMEDIEDIMADLKENIAKIREHGERATKYPAVFKRKGRTTHSHQYQCPRPRIRVARLPCHES